jgi:hypothetical protein
MAITVLISVAVIIIIMYKYVAVVSLRTVVLAFKSFRVFSRCDELGPCYIVFLMDFFV